MNSIKKMIEWDREHPARFLPTALLIPDKDIPKLEDYLLKHNFDMNRCLELLLEDHASVDEASVSKLRTAYQARYLFLQPKYFRVDAEVWYRFGVLARLAGVSRCRLFTAMMAAKWALKPYKVLRIFNACMIYTEFLSLAPKFARINRRFKRRPPAREPPQQLAA